MLAEAFSSLFFYTQQLRQLIGRYDNVSLANSCKVVHYSNSSDCATDAQWIAYKPGNSSYGVNAAKVFAGLSCLILRCFRAVIMSSKRRILAGPIVLALEEQ